MKLKTGFVSEYREKQEFHREQKRLREKHSIPDEHVIVVEKKHYIKTALNIVWSIVRGIITVLILVLATAGALALIYPSVRTELMDVLQTVYSTVRSYF